jgi:hypothetical protein
MIRAHGKSKILSLTGPDLPEGKSPSHDAAIFAFVCRRGSGIAFFSSGAWERLV